MSYSFLDECEAPVKVLSRVGRRADVRSGGRLSGSATTHPESTTDRVDEQLSALLESIEVELSERGLPGRGTRPPSSTSARPLGRARPAKVKIDSEPALRRVVARTQNIDPIFRGRFVDIVAGVMMGILVAFVALQILQDQTR